MKRLLLCMSVAAMACSPNLVGEDTFANQSPFPRSQLRVMTYNVKMKTAPSNSSDEFLDKNGNKISHADRAQHIASSILDIGDIDVVVFNEAFASDGQQAFVDALHGAYPHYVQYLDNTGVDLDSDSGLMLFSKHPFVALDEYEYKAGDVIANNGSGVDGDGQPNTEWGDVAFIDFGDTCVLPDCWANKGAGLVQIEHSVTGERFAVAFTHTQATYSDDSQDVQEKTRLVRRDQLDLIQKMIEGSLWEGTLWANRLFFMGDMNIDGNPHGDTTDYVKSFGGGKPFFSCNSIQCPGDTWSTKDQMLQDMWDHDQVSTDIGRTSGADLVFEHDPAWKLEQGTRLDYIFVNKPWPEIEYGSMCTQHLMIPWQVAGDGGDRSDHLPVLADINFDAPYCNPRSPRPVGFGANFSGPADKFFNDPDATITHPHSYQWYRIDQAGAYSFRFQSSDPSMRFDVYHNTDMSRPISDYYGVETDYGLKYDLPNPPYYVRVKSDNPTFTGSYQFAIHQHRCTSFDDACPLRPAISVDYPWPSQPVNGEDATYFDFFTENADTGKLPTVEFELAAGSSNSYDLVLHSGDAPHPPLTVAPIDSWDSYQANPGSVRGIAIPLAATGPTRYMLVVDRDGLTADTTKLTYKTNLTFFVPKKLKCIERNDNYPDQTDEIFQFFDVDDSGLPSFMAESPPYLPYSKVGEFDHGTVSATSFANQLGVIRYLEHIVPNLTEEDDGFNGDNDYLVIADGPLVEWNPVPEALFARRLAPLDPDAVGDANAKLTWEDKSGKDPDYRYRMYFRIAHERLTSP